MGGLQGHGVQEKFHDNLSIDSNVTGGTET